MATASITDNNTIFEELYHKYSKETYNKSGMFHLEEATILNPYLITTLPDSNMIKCFYKRKYSIHAFVLKFEDNREKIACILNKMMDMSRSSSERKNCLPVELIQYIAKFLGSKEPKSHYTPNDLSPCYQLAYKGPLPKLLSLDDLMILYKLGHVDIVKTIGYVCDKEEKYFVMSEKAYFSHLNPVVNKYYKNIEEMRKFGIIGSINFIKEFY